MDERYLLALTVSGKNLRIGLTLAQEELSNYKSSRGELATQLEELSSLSLDIVEHQVGNGAE